MRAEPADAAAIAAVLAAAFREFEPLYTPAAFRATTPTAAEIEARWSEGPVWIARLGGAAVGTVGAVERAEELYIRSMAVVPAARGRGVAGALLSTVESHARSRGDARLTLSTTPFLTGAIALYERSGFERRLEPLSLHGTELWAMTKALTPKAPGGCDL